MSRWHRKNLYAHPRLRCETLEDRVTPSISVVRDIATSSFTLASNPDSFVQAGSVTYFVAETPNHGRELWRTDGTSAGTVLVRDIRAGSSGSDPQRLVASGGLLYFTANDGVHGTELWRSNGTSTGTVLVRDIRPGPISSYPSELVDSAGALVFAADNGVNGREIWSNITGSPEMIVDGVFGSTGSDPQALTAVGFRVFYTANLPGNGRELWSTDSNLTTASQVLNINPGSTGSYPSQLTNYSGMLLFTANDGVYGRELWKSDGTSFGTALILDLYSGSSSSSPDFLVNVNGILYFSAFTPISGRELYRSLGTTATTSIVSDIRAGTSSSTPINLTAVGSTVFFGAFDGADELLWKSDGTSGGTLLVENDSPSPDRLTNVNGVLYYVATNASSGTELWKSEGTDPNTFIIEEIVAGSGSSDPQGLANINGTLYFSAAASSTGREIWRSSAPNAAATDIIRDINTSNGSSFINETTNFNGTLFFTAGNFNGDLWKSNGTSTGTSMLFDLSGGGGTYLSTSGLTNFNGFLYFAANDGITGFELWRSDGTSKTLVRDINPGVGSSTPTQLTPYNGMLYFTANTTFNGRELWKTDGTSGGTVLVADIQTGASSSNPLLLTVVGDTLYFRANDGSSGTELWKSNGTSTGTKLVRDIRPFASDSEPARLTNFNGTLAFIANDGTNGIELWTSDGTSFGTTLVANIGQGSSNAGTNELVVHQNRLYFDASDGIHGNELWTSNGTSTGTFLVEDINPGLNGSNPDYLTSDGLQLYFSATDSAAGRELWIGGRDEQSTFRIADINPGNGSSNPTNLANINGTIYFSANDGTNGTEIWTADAGTVVLAEQTFAGSGDGSPGDYVEVGGVLYFEATHPTLGRELHRIDGGLKPRITSQGGDEFAVFDQPENKLSLGTVTAYDPNGGPLNFSLVPGDDASLFTINPTSGALAFLKAPDFELPHDGNSDNDYHFRVRVSDGLLVDEQEYIVTVTDRVHDQASVYVNTAWSALANGTIIADADPIDPFNQTVTIGVNGFTTLEEGVDVVQDQGTLTLLPGTYGGLVTLSVDFKLRTHPIAPVVVSAGTLGTRKLHKTGFGPLTFTGLNSSGHGIFIEQGNINTANDALLGNNGVLVEIGALGSLSYTSSTTSSRVYQSQGFIEVVSPATLTLSNATLGGGQLTGAGTIATTSTGSTRFIGNTATTSLTILANGNDQFALFQNNAAITGAIGKTLTLTGFSNEPAGRLTLSGAASVSNFVTIGSMTVSGALNVFTGSGPNGLVFGGGSLTTINPGGSINTGATNALVTNGYVLNKGSFGNATGTITIDFGGKVEGNAIFGSLITKNGGVFSPGSSPGPASTHKLNINGGGRLEFEISNASGSEAALSGWDRITVQPTVFSPTAEIAFTATPASKYTILLSSRENSGDFNTPGLAANFNSALSYAWKFADGTAATQTGTFDSKAFLIDTADFTNTFTGGFSVELRDAGKNLYVVYTPVAGPMVTSFTVNNSQLQRSRLTTIEVNFATPVEVSTLTGPGAITLTRGATVVQTGATGANGRILVAPLTGMVSSVTLTFDNANGAGTSAGVEFGSLADGYWRLAIPSASFQSGVNDPQLRRLFGDSNNDGTVDGSTDFAQFGSVFGTSPGVNASGFDFNNDGTIDGSTDFAQFGARFGLTI